MKGKRTDAFGHEQFKLITSEDVIAIGVERRRVLEKDGLYNAVQHPKLNCLAYTIVYKLLSTKLVVN